MQKSRKIKYKKDIKNKKISNCNILKNNILNRYDAKM